MKTEKRNMNSAESKDEVEPLSADEFSGLSEPEQTRLIEYNQSLADYEQARGRRVLFNRAAKEALPFIVYCIFVSANALIATIVLVTQANVTLPYYLIIAGAMLLPLLAMPSSSFSDTIQWVKSYVENGVQFRS